MMGKVSGWALVCGAAIVLACSGEADPESAGGSSALYGGTAVPDASSVGTVWIEHLVNSTDSSGCNTGTGVAIAHDVILTSGHVVDWDHAQKNCAQTTKYLRFTMPTPGGAQVRLLTCANPSSTDPVEVRRRACLGSGAPGQTGGRFHTGYKGANTKPGADAALVRVGGNPGFNVNGKGTLYRRSISDKPTKALHYHEVTCYGMSANKLPIGAPPAKYGELRKADFTVLPFPHGLSIGPDGKKLAPSLDAYATSRGGQVFPTQPDPTGSDLNPDPVMVRGDSGGPCIEHSSGVFGPIVGLNYAGDSENLSGGAEAPRWNHHVAASGFRDWLRSHLRHQGFRFALDLDADGSADDGIEVRLSATQSLVIVASFNNGAQEFALDTLFPASSADVGGTFGGDFNDDGRDDILGTFGPALSAVPYYFSGAPSSPFTPVTTWQHSGPYEYMRVGRYNEDAIDDVAAVRFDGSEDVFLGEKNIGLTVPAQFVPRGFNWYDPAGDEEAFAISAPGLESSGFWAGQPIQSTTGRVYFVASPAGEGLEVYPMDLDLLKKEAPQVLSYGSVPGDGFGSSLAWGNFDGSSIGTHALIIGAPGVAVSSAARAGMVTYFKNDPDFVCPVPLVAGECPKQPIVVRQFEKNNLQGSPSANAIFGVRLSVGDYNGDSRDDLAILSKSDVHIMSGVQDSGLSTASPQSVFTWSQVGIVEEANLETAMASGDFNCDGYEDLAVSGTRELVGGSPAGAVVVVFGSDAGLSSAVRQRLDKVTLGLAKLPPQGERFGWALAAGNFNGDSSRGRPCVDLAIGVNEGSGSIRNGAVYVVTGGTGGLLGTTVQRLVPGGLAGGVAISGSSDPGDGFGGYLAVTRANLDRFDDLIIGAFNDDLAKGSAHVLKGGAAGITATGQAFWRQGDPQIGEMAETAGGHPLTIGDRFGWNVGGTSNGLVIIGASWESHEGPPNIPQVGWAGLIRLDDAQTTDVKIKGSAIHATEPGISNNPYRAVSFFGREITRARPAFVPVKTPPPRYGGNLQLQSGGLRGVCFPDVTPPVIESVTVNPSCLWPVNHKQAELKLGQQIIVSASDYCDPAPSVRIVDVRSNEAAGADDIVKTSDKVCLRSTRAGSGDGRVYTV